MIVCSVVDCMSPAKHKGLCGKHYKRLWRHGNVETRLIREYAAHELCSTPNCSNKPARKGRCHACAIRFSRKGYVERDRAPHGEGRPKTAAGYVLVTHLGKRIYEHRLVMEQKLGRQLKSGEVVHHKENVPLDRNHPDDLELFSSQSAHMQYHMQQRKQKQ